jgi:hypothetical protein
MTNEQLNKLRDNGQGDVADYIESLEKDIVEARAYVHMTLSGDELFSEVEEHSNVLLRKFALTQQAKCLRDAVDSVLGDPKSLCADVMEYRRQFIWRLEFIDEQAKELVK